MTDADKPASEDRPFWSLSHDDHHAIWVSFVGNVASALVIAAAIGGAIGLGRWARHGGPLWLLFAFTVLAFGAVGAGVWMRQGDRQGVSHIISKRAGVVERVAFRCLVLFAAFLVLMWIGLAAGIK